MRESETEIGRERDRMKGMNGREIERERREGHRKGKSVQECKGEGEREGELCVFSAGGVSWRRRRRIKRGIAVKRK